MPYNKKKSTKKFIPKINKGALIKAQQRVKNLLYQNQILNKLSSMKMINLEFGQKQINEHEAYQGKITMANHSGWDALPLMIFNLNNVVNDGSVANFRQTLKQNGYDFTTNDNVELQKIYGAGNNIAITTPDFRKLLLRWTKIKLCLWAETGRNVTYKVSLVKFNNRDINPQDYTTSISRQQKFRKAIFLNYFLRNQLSHPMISADRIPADCYKAFTTIWSKNYTLKEQTTLIDQRPHRIINIFRRFDKIIDYDYQTDLDTNTLLNVEDPETEISLNADATNNSKSDLKQSTFLIITSNCTLSYAEDNTNFHRATFDYDISSKYSVSNIEN